MHITESAKKHDSTMNGIIYQDLNADLANASPAIFTQAQAQKALQQAIRLFQQEEGQSEINEQKNKLMIFMSEDNKAHWVYRINFRSESINKNKKPVEQVYIMDATTFQVYASWDDIQNMSITTVNGGGFGGNIKTGKRMYDGLKII